MMTTITLHQKGARNHQLQNKLKKKKHRRRVNHQFNQTISLKPNQQRKITEYDGLSKQDIEFVKNGEKQSLFKPFNNNKSLDCDCDIELFDDMLPYYITGIERVTKAINDLSNNAEVNDEKNGRIIQYHPA